MPRHFRITVDGRSHNVAVEDLDQGSGPANAPAGKPAAATADDAPADDASPAVAPVLARIKVSLHREGSLPVVSGGGRIPRQARLGLAAKLIIVAAGFGVLALLVASIYWKREGEGQAVPAALRSDPVPLERTEAHAGQGATPASGAIGQPAMTSESRPAPPPTAPSGPGQVYADASQPPPPSDSQPTQVAAPPAAVPPAPPPAGLPTVAAAEPVSPPAPTALAPNDAGKPETPSSMAQVSVQLATVYSAAKAAYEWDRLRKRLPDMLAGRELVVGRSGRGGRRGWLVMTRGFEDNNQAAEFCRRLHAKAFHCVVITAE